MSPDLSFRRADVTPGNSQARRPRNEHDPAIIVEIAYQNGSWHRLVDNARRNTFATQMSIRITIGTKTFADGFRLF